MAWVSLSLVAGVVATAVLIMIGWSRHRRGKELERLRALRVEPTPPPFQRKYIPHYRAFIRTCRASAVVSLVAIPAFLFTAGPQPSVHTPAVIKSSIEVAAFLAFLTCVSSGGFLLECWLAERYGDRPRQP
jgi:hypothetical protein